jgi:hypothetical protein
MGIEEIDRQFSYCPPQQSQIGIRAQLWLRDIGKFRAACYTYDIPIAENGSAKLSPILATPQFSYRSIFGRRHMKPN